MNSSNSSQVLFRLIMSSVLAVLLLAGCDRADDEIEPVALDEEIMEVEPEYEVAEPDARDDQFASTTDTTRNTDNNSSDLYDDSTADPYDDSMASNSAARAQPGTVIEATADVEPTANYSAEGEVNFTADMPNRPMEVLVNLTGLTPGEHGLHIHEYGDCSAPDASSAGDHFNPTNEDHGSPQDEESHLGDLGNVVADENGVVDTTLTVSDLGFDGSNSILEKAIVVHAQADDLETDPAGASGDRVGCGVIRPLDEAFANREDYESPLSDDTDQ